MTPGLRPPRRALVLLLLLLSVSAAAAAEKYALLVGIGSYPRPIQQLDGPRHDVEALRDELVRNWGFEPTRVTQLVDARATKATILRELDRLADLARPGDYVFLYYSGHGTSAFDPDLAWQGVELGRWTGALIPYDYIHAPPPGHDAARWEDRLIVGRRDLRPRLERLDDGRNVFVVFDTCFSGNSVRSISRRPVRWVSPAVPLRSPRSISHLDDPFDDDAIFGAATAREEDYPYRRLIYLSAARKFERAEEVSAWETVDGRPHGALTNALLQGLGGAAASGRDGFLTYSELYDYVHDEVSEKTQHMPQLLYPDSRPELVHQPVFAHRGRPPGDPPPIAAFDELRVRVGPGLSHLRRPIAALERVSVVDGGVYHVALERQADGLVALYHPSGDRIAGGFDDRSPGRLLQRIARQVQVQALIDLAYRYQDFDLTLDLADGRGFLYGDQRFEIAAGADRPAVLMLLNVDKTGTVSVLYPVSVGELQPTRALRETFQVVPPYGTEYLKLFAFRRPPPGLDRFLHRKIDVLDPRFDELVELLRRPGVERAQTRLKVVTAGELVSGLPGR